MAFCVADIRNANARPPIAMSPPKSNSGIRPPPTLTCGSLRNAIVPKASRIRSSVGPMPPNDILNTLLTAVARNASPATSRYATSNDSAMTGDMYVETANPPKRNVAPAMSRT